MTDNFFNIEFLPAKPGRTPCGFGPFDTRAAAEKAIREMRSDDPNLFKPGTYRIVEVPGTRTPNR